jgi:ABC-2 type transport system permease protein
MNTIKKFISYKGLVRKEWIRFLRIWPQSLLPPAITTTLYFLIFGHVIGSRVGNMNGIPYMNFIMPGLVMMAVITNSYSNVVSSFFGARYNRSVEELLVSPMPNWLIVAGYVTGGVGRGFLIGIIVSIVGLLFTGMSVAHIALSLLTIILCSIVFCLAGFINGIFARKFDDTSIVVTFVLTPLIYLGGVFYSISSLPHGWQYVSEFNPIYYVIELFRYAILGVVGIPVWHAFAAVMVFIIIMFSFCVFCLRKGIGVKS